MTEWITLQEAADLIGVRKGTLCMWRLRNRFPFRSKGKGRGLVVSKNSVQGWIGGQGWGICSVGDSILVTSDGSSFLCFRDPRAEYDRHRRAQKKAAAPRRKSAPRLSLRTDAGLEDIQSFVAALKSGRSVRVTPEKKGYVLTLGE